MNKKRCYMGIGTLCAAMSLTGVCNSAHAATATANVEIDLPVNSPTCTVTNNNATVSLPNASSASVSLPTYMSINLPTPALQGAPWVTSTTLNQTATVSCSTAGTIVTSFVVQPGSGASLRPGATAQQFMTDTASNRLAGGDALLSFEQVSWQTDGSAVTSAPFSYQDGAGNVSAFTSPSFITGPLNSGVSLAYVVWRPVLANTGSSPIGTPVGGSFSGSAQIVANY